MTNTSAPGWRNVYEGFEGFPRLSFAWEYLRRNEHFQQSCGTASWPARQIRERLTVFADLSRPFHEYCLFATSFDEDARSATYFWNPDVCSKVLRLLALPPQKAAKPFILAEGDLQTVLLTTSGGVQHVLIRDGVRCLQLCVRGESLLRPVTLVFDTGSVLAERCSQALMLSCFLDYRAGLGLLDRYFPAASHAKRLTFVLKALDGWLNGFAQREIAVALFGSERVERDWRDPRENLRDQVRHAITRGRALADHGYRALLC